MASLLLVTNSLPETVLNEQNIPENTRTSKLYSPSGGFAFGLRRVTEPLLRRGHSAIAVSSTERLSEVLVAAAKTIT